MNSTGIVIHSTSTSEKYYFTWAIEDFSNRDRFVQSPDFFPSKIIPVKFYIELDKTSHPNIQGFRIFLRRREMENIPRTLKIEPFVMIMNPNGEYVPLDVYKIATYFVHKTKKVEIGIHSLHSLNYLDSFVLKFQFELFGHMQLTTSNKNLQQFCYKEKNADPLSGSATYFQSCVFSDLEIHVGKDVFNVHRVLLAIRSPVFKTMLENNWEEPRSKSMRIEGVDSNTFKLFLEYLYTGVMTDRSYLSAKTLYPLSVKYGVMDLLAECRKILTAQFSTDFLYEIMVLSYLNKDDVLKQQAINYFTHHFIELSSKLEWKSVMKSYPDFAFEVLSSITSTYRGCKRKRKS